MCGIVAIIGKESSVLIENALKKIKHRGLDATKIIANELITFGFNRLAINDKSEYGHQPFEYGNLIGVFNAEIYNSEELKNEFGLSTISKSDTELILPLFEKLGKSVIHYLDGFYSGIIFNKVSKQLFVMRDYIGKKPLFYVKSNNFDFIVSELKAVNQIDCFQIIPKGFSEIAGSQIKTIEMHKISKLSKDNLKQVITSAIEKRIPKEEKQFGVFLSGGLDSSIIASVISKLADNVYLLYT
jgi:asparagine synthase (glutamine-hydrolysing)